MRIDQLSEELTATYLTEYGKRADALEEVEKMRSRTCKFCGETFDMGRGWTEGTYYLCNACYESLVPIVSIEEEPEEEY